MTNIFGHRIRSELLLLYAAESAACFGAIYILLSYQMDPMAIGGGLPGGSPLLHAFVLALASGLVSGAGGLYQYETWSRSSRLLLGTLVAAVLLLPLALGELLFLGPTRPNVSIWRELADVLATSFAAVWLTRLIFVGAWHAGLFTRMLAIVRRAETDEKATAAPALASALGSKPGSLYQVAFTVQAGQDLQAALGAERLRRSRIWGVMAERAALPLPIVEDCEARGIRVFDEAEFIEYSLGRVNTALLEPDWLAKTRGLGEMQLAARVVRRGIDVMLSLGVLLVTLPVLVLTACAIKLDSRGPLFYCQERVGRDGRIFILFKFRSMVTDAEAEGAPQWASQRDPRTTRVGRLIRRCRIDEIPQVLNVLRGDMAFVGPRPERPAFVATLGQVIPHYHDRTCVKPGITGWAQVNYHYGASVEDARVKLAYDLYYVKRRSLFLDLLILVATVRVVLFQEGSR